MSSHTVVKVIFFTNALSSQKLVNVLNDKLIEVLFPTKPRDFNFLNEYERELVDKQVYQQLDDNELKMSYVNSQKNYLKHDFQTIKIGINIEFDL